MDTAEIRRRWLTYFEGKGHAVIPSASLISPDPTLLFTVAGMVPFIPYLTGQQTAPWPRATSVQKCVRTLDIDEVGLTTRHGTFFQMNGNFSFGDYFKEGAISFAWELVTSEQHNGGYGFSPDDIWVTVYEDDAEAAGLWRRIAGLPEERIQRRGKKDNYWHTGVPGPGGPCSEIYVDRGPEHGRDGGPVVDEDRFLEIWNLVFMQEELTAVRSKEDFDVAGPLPSRNIDTGMGLERVAYLLQGKDNLYEIDEVYPVIARACELAGSTYGRDRDTDVRLRVVADHVRSSLMLIGDGVTPGNEGRGYVLRRLLRRSVRAMRLLGHQDPCLPELLPVSMARMKESYPELERDFARISATAYAEEETFRRTLTTGTTILDTAVSTARSRAAGGAPALITGEQAFQLHDTYGFPIDLTLEMAAEQGVAVDRDGFTALMKQQRERARADARAKKGGRVDTSVYRQFLDGRAPTVFTGYDGLTCDSAVTGLLVDGAVARAATQGQIAEVVLEHTPFYAESGGQEADAGFITGPDGLRLEVLDVQKPIKGLVVHKVQVAQGEVVLGQDVHAAVDENWRIGACQAHTGTHVVHAALRQVVGPNALQAGSYNKPGYLRFDFTANAGLSDAARSEVEEIANLAIRSDYGVQATEMPLDEAKAMGAIAMFGEKYDDTVRVVEMGGGEFSRELCGGTHVAHASQIGMVALTSEASIGAGTRRVEALVGIEAFRSLAAERTLVAGLTETLKVRPEQVAERVDQLLAQLRDAQRKLADLQSRQVLARAGELAGAARDVFGVAFVGHQAGDVDANDVRTLVLDVRNRLGSERPAVVAVSGTAKGRPVVVVATNELAREWGVKAGALVKVAASTLGGGGGGKDDLAQGGGTDAGRVGEALAAVEHAVGRQVTS